MNRSEKMNIFKAILLVVIIFALLTWFCVALYRADAINDVDPESLAYAEITYDMLVVEYATASCDATELVDYANKYDELMLVETANTEYNELLFKIDKLLDMIYDQIREQP